MLTPTADSLPDALPFSVAAIPGLPDESALARLAGELFRALPGREAPSSPSAPAVSGLAIGEPGPALQSLAAPAIGQPAVDAVPVPPEFGVPEAYAAALPMTAPISAPAGVPGSPYYFLGEAAALSSAHQAPTAVADNHVVAHPFKLPGEAALRRVLDELAGERSPPPAAPPVPGHGGYYFIDQPASVPRADAARFPAFDVQAVRRDFPILAERVNGKPLVWFDNAATTQKPQAVIDRLVQFYQHENSNIHRAAHELAARSTDAYEAARSKVAHFLGASSAEEIIFVRGATEAINLVAKTWGRQNIGEGDEIVVSLLEHHANIVPWQQLAKESGAHIRVIPVDDKGQILLQEYQRLLNDRTKLVAISQVSNALGTVTPVKEIVELAHRAGARVLVDGAQSVSHMRVDVQAIDADFFVFSGHKVFAPTGIGVVYGKRDILEDTPPWQGGGNMIADVTFERTLYQGVPARFEAGTGNIADAVGLGAAIDYVARIGIENIARYEHDLLLRLPLPEG
ncbi:aminotransferase class V-fold PLP-dependent enzyme [Accumulibacter sp.]|uniref:aminotransferase class V-fold PLP-dependent enzyme n=1 Tax=Accumulibacter sp. TaxID=2053492 RepID=UPI0025E47A7D|nr:aminotransferase class V-fold PLP-dependent enzyme [Accumulibacter sp.]MCM8613332.1 aminotransferase class V-fold PLP-dependent enzyme [Accumulibacter sp.]MCM8637607.1 aminotransferase class V-fold PLP-dependent enzyme [Accumulibacter sp.]MCM8641004.1 aminotransferase class V-fold PLP-dependent enzyme [Accumulibacter sp.]